jgi:fructosamine-3-kinase
MINLQTNLMITPAQAEAILFAWLRRPAECTGIRRLHGGMVNSVLRLDFDRAPFSAVLKLNTASDAFVHEARALDYLHTYTRFPCPQVYLQDGSAQIIPYAFLLLETIPGLSLAELHLPPEDYGSIERQLAGVLLELHGHTRLRYGDIGEGPGIGRWSDVFVPRLLEMRYKAEVVNRLPPVVLAGIDAAIQSAHVALQDQGPPTLVHGDLWDGNLIVRQEEGSWRLAGIVDPGLEYADVEVELAYLECFNTWREAFFGAYAAARPIRPGYARRRLFYWLHTALIHVWLFGDPHYCEFAAQTAATIASG